MTTDTNVLDYADKASVDTAQMIKSLSSDASRFAKQWAESQTESEILNMIAEQRTIIDEITREADIELATHKAWDVALTNELQRRMSESNMTSMNIEHVGRATVVVTQNYNVKDPQALYDFVVAEGSIAIFGTKVKASEVKAYRDANEGELPAGIEAHQTSRLRVTRNK